MKKLLTIVLFGWALTGCKTTVLTYTWIGTRPANTDYRNVMVVSLNDHQTLTLRHNMEAAIASNLSRYGYHVVSSCEQFNANLRATLTRDQVKPLMANLGFDAVLTVDLAANKETYCAPARIYIAPFPDEYGNALAYNNYFDLFTAPVICSTDEKYLWDFQLYVSPESERPVYTCQVKSGTDNYSKLSYQCAKLLTDDLLKRKMITDHKKAGMLRGF